MTDVTVALTGEDKENIQAVVLGGKRWGLNGEPYDRAQAVDPGQQNWTVDFPDSDSQGQIEVPDQESAVLTVDAGDDRVTVSF